MVDVVKVLEKKPIILYESDIHRCGIQSVSNDVHLLG
jgi:hypothetical protein